MGAVLFAPARAEAIEPQSIIANPALAAAMLDVMNANQPPTLINGTLWGQMGQVQGEPGGNVFSGAVPGPVRGPQGLYAYVNIDTQVQNLAQYAPNLNVDAYLTNYFSLLLSYAPAAPLTNAAVSGLDLRVYWSLLNPQQNVYSWHYLTDAFTAVNLWNTANPGLPPKTIQFNIIPGFYSPAWLFSQMTSCDPMFANPPQPAPANCDYATFLNSEGLATPVSQPLPLPWSSNYKTAWQTFLQALNAQFGSNPLLVSIAIGGPTSASTEMILPNQFNDPADFHKWNSLLANHYSDPSYQSSDRAFIEEWDNAIDLFGKTFSGLTLIATTGNGLPIFTTSSASLLTPPPSMSSLCSGGPGGPLAMDCAAQTSILAYFAQPDVGGANAKAVEEEGLFGSTQANASTDLTDTSIKTISAAFDWIVTPLAGNVLSSGSLPVFSRLLAGLEFATSFAVSPSMAVTGATGGPQVSPEQALYDLLTQYFNQTAAGGQYYVTPSAGMLSFLQVYDDDILYGLDILACASVDPAPNAAVAPKQALENVATGACHPPSQFPKATIVQGNGATMSHSAQFLLTLANDQILTMTSESAAPTPVPNLPNGPYTCTSGYVWRGAFAGDYVCVTPADAAQAASDNAAAQSRFEANATGSNGVPYGTCQSGYLWRQANAGDYVCVTPQVQAQVASDNSAAYDRFEANMKAVKVNATAAQGTGISASISDLEQ